MTSVSLREVISSNKVEEQFIKSSSGPITIIGDRYDTALFLNGIPIYFTWIREVGSTWKYQIAKSVSEIDVIQDRSFSDFVKYGYLSNKPLVQQFDYIISKLGPGKCSLRIDYLLDELYYVESIVATDDYVHYNAYAGIEGVIEAPGIYHQRSYC